MKAFLSISLFFVLCILQAQDIPDTQIHFAKSAYTLSDLFDEIEQSHALRFQYKADWIENLSYYPESPQILLEDFLESLKKQLGLSLLFKEPRYIILLGAPAAPAGKAAAAQTGSSAERVRVGDISKSPEADARLYGVVREGQSAKPLSGASISIQGTALGTVTDEQGRYELILKPGTYNIRYSYVNLQAMEFELSIFNSGSFDVDMYEDITMLSAIMVKARAETANVSEASMGRTVMDQEEIRRIPAFLGEVDVNRVVLSLPGVVSVGEGAPGFNVRGGMVSQNLVLMDEIPIYNTSHLAGFFSAYNPDLVDEIKFYRGGIPAQFGGRVSSVLDISLQEANYEKWSGGGGAGLIASRFNISGPIKKNQTAFTAGMRGAYPNYIIRSLPDIELRNSDAYFYDLNFKVDHRNEKGQYLGVSAYKSRDNIDFAGNALYDYGNTGISFRLASPLGTYGLVKGSYVISQYDYTLAGGELDRAFELNSLLGDNRINLSYSYFGFNRHEIEFGAQLFSYNIQPGNYRPLVDGTLESVLLPHERAIESGIYLQDEIDVSNQLKLSVGIRYSRFNRIGPSSQLLYAAGRPTAESAIVDTIQYASGESMAKYGGLEPRLFVTYIMSPNQSLKLGYHRTRQFIHLVTNTTAVTPVDLWKLSDNYIRPNIADQLSIGYFRNDQNNSIESSVEVFYKQVFNSIDFKDGADVFLNELVAEDLLQGMGQAYGAEFLIRKNKGKARGWLAYTYARTLMQIDGINSNERINNGAWYPTNFDRPHDLKFFADYRMTNRFSVSMNFNYASGRPITLPESYYIISGTPVANYSFRNTYRIPDYHRLDIAATLDGTLKKKKRADASWTIGIYNVYGRKNPYSVFFRRDERGNLQAYRLAVIGRPIFAVTYNFTF